MGKKSRSSPSNSTAAAAMPAKSATAAAAATEAPALGEQSALPEHEGDARWGTVQRSLKAMLVVAGFAMTDLRALRDGAPAVIPDHKPLLAVVAIFGWVVWRRWKGSGKKGLNPLIRTLGFVVILAGCLATLPFNSTVTMLEVPLLSADECQVVEAAALETLSLPGYKPSFFLYDLSTEIPLQDISPEVSDMVSDALRKKLMPLVALEYAGQGKVTLDDSLYVEHYPAFYHPPPATHLRRGQLALRVQLTPPESKYVGGGGVFLDSMGKTVTPGTGNGLVLPAKLWHGSSEPGPNARSVLVGSLSVAGQDPWQRFVGVWRLWGLFSRSVRYIADKRLDSSGVDTIPAPDPEPVKDAGVVGTSGDAEASSGSNKLEF
ncbi:unnamed protein product [Scytosiphon promiscuus]